VTFRPSFSSLYARKLLLRGELERSIGRDSAERAARDGHARRRPRPCGLAIHSVVGCSARCAYCYVPDMGFDFARARPYGLAKEELLYALLTNPYFFPTIAGTYLPFGSIGEPFHPAGAKKTLEYMAGVARILGNPIQFSTKMLVSERLADELGKIGGSPISPLITVVTLREHRRLEPGAPPPRARLDGMRALRKRGFHPFLFFRPIIPGVNVEEAEEIFEEARESGAVGVVLGGLRVTEAIVRRLEERGFSVEQILSRVSGLRGSEQVSVFVADLKRELIELAREKGLIPLASACCATTLSIMLETGTRIPCANLCFARKGYCTGCPVDCGGIRVEVDEGDVKLAAKEVLGVECRRVESCNGLVRITVGSKSEVKKLRRRAYLLRILEGIYRKRIAVVS